MSPRSVLREVLEIIGSLHKGPDTEGPAERKKPLSPNVPKNFRSSLKSFFEVVVEVSVERKASRIFRSETPTRPYLYPILNPVAEL